MGGRFATPASQLLERSDGCCCEMESCTVKKDILKKGENKIKPTEEHLMICCGGRTSFNTADESFRCKVINAGVE